MKHIPINAKTFVKKIMVKNIFLMLLPKEEKKTQKDGYYQNREANALLRVLINLRLNSFVVLLM